MMHSDSRYGRIRTDDLRWHDLRHTWKSWRVQAGTALLVSHELGGWQVLEIVLKYGHLASDRLDRDDDRMSGLRLVKAPQTEFTLLA
jgi:hypothetical protein